MRCWEILHGNAPKAFQCRMKVKDAVLAVHKALAGEAAKERGAGLPNEKKAVAGGKGFFYFYSRTVDFSLSACSSGEEQTQTAVAQNGPGIESSAAENETGINAERQCLRKTPWRI